MTEEVSPLQIKAIALILSGRKSVEIAEALDVTPQTLSRWKSEPAVKAILNRSKLEMLHSARDRLQVSAEAAVNGLVEIATKAESDETRRKACVNIVQLVGLADPSSGLFAWGIGGTSLQEVVEEELRQQYIRDLATPDFIFRRRQEQMEEGEDHP